MDSPSWGNYADFLDEEAQCVMFNIMIAPSKYVQGPGVLGNIGDHIYPLGQRAFFIGGPTAISIVKECAFANLKEKGI